MKHELILLAGTKETEKALKDQLQSVFKDLISIKSYACDEGISSFFTNTLIVYSSSLIEEEVSDYIDHSSCTIIKARRTVNYEYIDRIFELPYGKKILYVNDFLRTAREAVSTLKRLGIDHVEYIPYSSGEDIAHDVDTAISPGETALIPDWIPVKIDIGVRLIDLHTITRIIHHFKLSEQVTLDITDRYTKKIIELSQRLGTINRKANTLNKFLNKVVDGVNDGILAFQEKGGEITVFNEVLEQMLGMSASSAKGRKLSRVFQNIELTHFLTSTEEEDQKYFTLRQNNVMVYRFRMKSEGVIVATFKDLEESIEMEKVRKRELQRSGHIAKYTFDSILGSSPVISETISIARKLARSELPILIIGETGTGKELFSSAIHNESSRCSSPYLAVNCSALSEDLLESELFGYVEGAFTGALKGGKKGLFEQADGGTLFLDEIGDISMKLQTRLLRVLEEMEVRRIGGNKNIPIDVRIIAATNKDLAKRIAEGTFREDLYHRLKILSLRLPSLRERAEDIPELIQYFLHSEQSSITQVDQDVLAVLSQAKWTGNVRELKNTLLYMMTISDGNRLSIKLLPKNDNNFAKEAHTKHTAISLTQSEEYRNILSLLTASYKEGKRASREKLSSDLQNTSTPLTVQQIRTRLHELQELGYVVVYRGRKGTEITEAGLKWLKNNEECFE